MTAEHILMLAGGGIIGYWGVSFLIGRFQAKESVGSGSNQGQKKSWDSGANQERQRAEQERQQAEQERSRAESERKQAQQERERAEQERQRSEQERRQRAEQERTSKSEPMNWHDVLGVSYTATIEEIKAAYKTKIRQYHPDRVANLAPELKEIAERRSKEINIAYQEAKQIKGF